MQIIALYAKKFGVDKNENAEKLQFKQSLSPAIWVWRKSKIISNTQFTNKQKQWYKILIEAFESTQENPYEKKRDNKTSSIIGLNLNRFL